MSVELVLRAFGGQRERLGPEETTTELSTSRAMSSIPTNTFARERGVDREAAESGLVGVRAQQKLVEAGHLNRL